MSTSKEKPKHWRDYMPPEDMRGSWCPLMNIHCIGAQCALWIPRYKECAIKSLAVELIDIRVQLE